MRSEWFRDITSLGGAPVYIAIAVIALHTDVHFFYRLVAGFLFSYLFVTPFRILFFRERPERQNYSNIMHKIDAGSFPSQHVTRGTILWFLVSSFFNTPIFWIISIIAIILIAYTRISLKRHHKADAIGGFIAGLIAFFLILYLNPYIASAAQSLGFP
ncbi:MAG: phosphatase PAP2 family protein [Candidatus Aenigmarchaeota archaeon]|nr:phosphatase PAP2 family protein [Candidatus Aenigmarchaeota archaeon]